MSHAGHQRQGRHIVTEGAVAQYLPFPSGWNIRLKIGSRQFVGGGSAYCSPGRDETRRMGHRCKPVITTSRSNSYRMHVSVLQARSFAVPDRFEATELFRVDIDEEEGWAFLVELFQHQVEDRFQYRHASKPDMLVMWDNRCLLHRATGGYEGYQRVLHRTTVAG